VIKKCQTCSGEGRHGSNDRLKVKIPKGVATGQKLKVRGKGHDGLGDGVPGDLLVLVDVDEHPIFRRRGEDLICDLPLPYSLAVLGGSVAVPTLVGHTEIQVPPGTAQGKTLRLSGKGLPAAKGRRVGDLHFKVVIDLPKNLDAKQRAALQSYSESLHAEQHPASAAFSRALATHIAESASSDSEPPA
jgi:molecular chaperone DnaJ